MPRLSGTGKNVRFPREPICPLMAPSRPPLTTFLAHSGKLLDRLEIARDFRRCGDHRVTTGFFRSVSVRNSSTRSRAYCDGLGVFRFLYWVADIIALSEPFHAWEWIVPGIVLTAF
jgi:hypothetical protein